MGRAGEHSRGIYEVRQIFSGTLYQPKVPFCGLSRKSEGERESEAGAKNRHVKGNLTCVRRAQRGEGWKGGWAWGILWVARLAYLDELILCLLSARPAAAGPRLPFPQWAFFGMFSFLFFLYNVLFPLPTPLCILRLSCCSFFFGFLFMYFLLVVRFRWFNKIDGSLLPWRGTLQAGEMCATSGEENVVESAEKTRQFYSKFIDDALICARNTCDDRRRRSLYKTQKGLGAGREICTELEDLYAETGWKYHK